MRKKIVIRIGKDDHASMQANGLTTPDVLDALLSAMIAAIKKATVDGTIPAATLLRDVAINELQKNFPDKEETHE